SWLVAAALLSTRPFGRGTSRTTASVMAVGTLDDFLGQATHRPPSGLMAAVSASRRLARAARSVVKNSTTSTCLPNLVVEWAPAGRSRSKPSGAPSRATVAPSLMPSFLGSGVPEY